MAEIQRRQLKIYIRETGGNEEYEFWYAHLMNGGYYSDKKAPGTSNPCVNGYVTDTNETSATNYNLWVNASPTYMMADKNYGEVTLINFIMGNFVNGTGPENIEFPKDGYISRRLKNSGVVQEALDFWYTLNRKNVKKGYGLVGTSSNTSFDPADQFKLLQQKRIFTIENMIGSASIDVTVKDDNTLEVEIFNITNLTSGDFGKHLPWNCYPIAVVRDLMKKSPTKFGNVSQTYSFTMKIDHSRLK